MPMAFGKCGRYVYRVATPVDHPAWRWDLARAFCTQSGGGILAGCCKLGPVWHNSSSSFTPSGAGAQPNSFGSTKTGSGAGWSSLTKWTRVVELSLGSSTTPLQTQLLELNLGVGAIPNRPLDLKRFLPGSLRGDASLSAHSIDHRLMAAATRA